MKSEMDAERRFHIETYAADLIRSSVPHTEAYGRANIEFGGIERAKRMPGRAGVNIIENLIQDAVFQLVDG